MTRQNKRNLLRKLMELIPGQFHSSRDYWVRRYAEDGDSGDGSYGELARFKANFLNSLVTEKALHTVLEFGCGDGNQLSLAHYEKYMGVDISPDAIQRCKARFADDATKTFLLDNEYAGEKADVVLSLDVLYHLIEDDVFHGYMTRCFDAANRVVVIYASNHDRNPFWQKQHVRHRCFTDWIAQHRPDWKLVRTHKREDHLPPAVAATTFADFYVFSR